MITADSVRARQKEFIKQAKSLDETQFWKEFDALVQEAIKIEQNFVLYSSVIAFQDYKRGKLTFYEERIIFILTNAGFKTREIISDHWGGYKRSLRISW